MLRKKSFIFRTQFTIILKFNMELQKTMILILNIRRITVIFQSLNSKKTLATLKQQSDGRNISEAGYISKLIRLKYAKKNLNIENCNDDEK